MIILHHLAVLLLLVIVVVSKTCNGFIIAGAPLSSKVKYNDIISIPKESSKLSAIATSSTTIVEVGEIIGGGSYGVVHNIYCCDSSGDDGKTQKKFIGKRALTVNELSDNGTTKNPKEKSKRCEYYINVEEHCFKKLDNHPQIPSYKGTVPDNEKRNWMLFDIIKKKNKSSSDDGDDNEIAPSLDQIMKLDRQIQLKGGGSSSSNGKDDDDDSNHHHLQSLQNALGIKKSDDSDDDLGKTLDIFLESLLNVISYVHSKRIVHRDVKPGNILISENGLVSLIDFGSAADIEPLPKKKGGGLFQQQKRIVGMDDKQRIAISPIYAAPELFIDLRKKGGPLTFDVFSIALIYCQLLFGYLDERTDVGFHQQLELCDWDLEEWLDKQLLLKVRPKGLQEALIVLSNRPGLFRLLSDMFQPNPQRRVQSFQAYNRFQNILNANNNEEEESLGDVVTAISDDGLFFKTVVETMGFCELEEEEEETISSQYNNNNNRPLHFVASFKRKDSLGLVLSEVGDSIDEDIQDMENSYDISKWIDGTKDSKPGQVFVKKIINGGQASRMGIFEIGDNLQGVGELPLAFGGFERVLELLEDQPKKSKYVTLHFDRKKSSLDGITTTSSSVEVIDGNGADDKKQQQQQQPVRPIDQGVWSLKGRRDYQEDRFIIHEFQSNVVGKKPVLVAGVMDGHGGTAASKMVSDTLPSLFSNNYYNQKKNVNQQQEEEEKENNDDDDNNGIANALEKSWDIVCNSYRKRCDAETCIANYDSREGILEANIGGDDLVPGTTSSIIALDESNGELIVLNCGDSRTLLLDENGLLLFQTKDHSPQNEIQRLQQGINNGYDYSLPKCSLSRWFLNVGDYEYALSRSLEGAFATSKGIISTPDITKLQTKSGMSIIMATDGIFEVMDSEQVCHYITEMRSSATNNNAADVAKSLCAKAIELGSEDNVSVVIVYL